MGDSIQINNNEISQIDGLITTLRTDDSKVGEFKQNRADNKEWFNSLEDKLHEPWVDTNEWGVSRFPSMLENYKTYCNDLVNFEERRRLNLIDLENKGLTKYENIGSNDRKAAEIIEFRDNLPNEHDAIQKAETAAIINVSNCLRALRTGYHTLESKMQEFNRSISKRKLSDLKLFKLELVKDHKLYDAIELLISKADNINAGETFELFDSRTGRSDDSVDDARQTLMDACDAENAERGVKGGLHIKSLFHLNFISSRYGQDPESFQSIDSAASHGTVIMAKMVTGLAMLNIMRHSRDVTRYVCYLDEAKSLDRANQKSLISIADDFKFNIIFASPDPLDTVDYCVPVLDHKGRHYITEKTWQKLSKRDNEQDEKNSTEETAKQ